jgi:DNA-binding GntR family transcriptional regulator
MASSLRTDDVDSLFKEVRFFHETLYAAAKKPLILSQVMSLRDLAERYIRRYLTLPGRLAHVVRNHREMLRAAQAHEAANVEWLIRQELQVTRDALLASLSRDEEGEEGEVD